MLRRQNRPDEARRLLDQAKADNPTNASVRLALSAVHAAGGNLDDALKELESLPRQNWTPRLALTAGQLNVQTGRFREAVRDAERAQADPPGCAGPTVLARSVRSSASIGRTRRSTSFERGSRRLRAMQLMHFGLALGLTRGAAAARGARRAEHARQAHGEGARLLSGCSARRSLPSVPTTRRSRPRGRPSRCRRRMPARTP